MKYTTEEIFYKINIIFSWKNELTACLNTMCACVCLFISLWNHFFIRIAIAFTVSVLIKWRSMNERSECEKKIYSIWLVGWLTDWIIFQTHYINTLPLSFRWRILFRSFALFLSFFFSLSLFLHPFHLGFVLLCSSASIECMLEIEMPLDGLNWFTQQI